MANPTLQLKVNNVDLSAYTVQDSWNITQQWGRQGDTAHFLLYDEFSSPANRHFTPQAIQPVVFTDTGSGAVLFSGLVTNPNWQYISPNACEWYIDCRDFTYFADQTVVTGDFSFQSTDQIVKTLTAQAGLGISTNHVQTGVVVPRYRINYKPLSTVWTQLATLSSGATATASNTSAANQYGWKVIADSITGKPDLHWYNASQGAGDTSVQSGITFTDNLVAGDAGGGTATRGFIDWDHQPKYEFDGGNLRNSCVVRGANVQNAQTDTFTGNGATSSWPLTFTILTTNPHFKLTVNGFPFSCETVATATARKGHPAFLVQENKAGQWFLTVNTSSSLGFIPAPNTHIKCSYNYEAPVVARVDDLVSQGLYRSTLNAAGIGNTGVFQHYISDRNIKDHGTAQQRAQREIQEYSKVQERFTFSTTDDWPGDIHAGQIFTVNTQYIPNSQNKYVSGFTANFLATKVTINPSAKRANFRTYNVMGIRVS